jgi:hypothetical protein
MGLTYFRSNRKHLVAKFKIGPRRALEAVASKSRNYKNA